MEGSSRRALSSKASRGTSCYRAPELLLDTSPHFTNKVDMWAIGCILYELVLCKRAFREDWFILKYVDAGQPFELLLTPEVISDDRKRWFLGKVIRELLDVDPKKRPKARDLYERFISWGSDGVLPMKRMGTDVSEVTSVNSDEAIEEDEDTAPAVRLETVSPPWDRLDRFNETLKVEGFSHNAVHGADTLNNMMEHDDYISLNVLKLTIHKRQFPFAQGALRVAHYTRTAASTNHYIVKSFERAGWQPSDGELATDMRCQALCKAFALEFNALVRDKHSIDFVMMVYLKGKEGTTSSDSMCISLESFLPGKIVKYNNNTSYVNEEIPNDPFNQAAQAFSHFTFERSQGRVLVCNLEGVGKLMTDPIIHTVDPKRFILSTTNLGEDGFKFFFCSHKCNDVCRQLGLKSNASMFVSGNYEFRETWPTMADMVCCSNKLCSRILRWTNAKASAEFPGYRWCDVCWPQLELFKFKRTCLGPGPLHEFKTSRFFYESQGRSTPLKCSDHDEQDARARDGSAVSSYSTGVVGRVWAHLKSATRSKKG
jgi:Alpha-kinase family/Protein kinase domain